MTKDDVKNLPLIEMLNAAKEQLNLTRQETRFFELCYKEGLHLQECADEMCIDIQVAKIINRKVKFKLAFIDTSKIPHWEEYKKENLQQ